ncbi:CAAX amino terminal protease self- immunity [bacterium BMS3Abin10]|nr:CAAX amino terminal protease self- immunity [bacterium BMS3Abin10]
MGYTRTGLMVIALTVEGITLALAFLLSWYFDIPLLPLSGNVLRDVLTGTAGAVPPFVLLIFCLSKYAAGIPVLGSLRKTMLSDVKAVFANTRFADLVIISILAGLAEELLFRGVLQIRFGIIIASAVFGLAHFITPSYAFIALIMGFYIGGFFYFSGSLLAVVYLHFIYDLAALTYLEYFTRDLCANHKRPEV